jgi:hypothetical protein
LQPYGTAIASALLIYPAVNCNYSVRYSPQHVEIIDMSLSCQSLLESNRCGLFCHTSSLTAGKRIFKVAHSFRALIPTILSVESREIHRPGLSKACMSKTLIRTGMFPGPRGSGGEGVSFLLTRMEIFVWLPRKGFGITFCYSRVRESGGRGDRAFL